MNGGAVCTFCVFLKFCFRSGRWKECSSALTDDEFVFCRLEADHYRSRHQSRREASYRSLIHLHRQGREGKWTADGGWCVHLVYLDFLCSGMMPWSWCIHLVYLDFICSGSR